MDSPFSGPIAGRSPVPSHLSTAWRRASSLAQLVGREEECKSPQGVNLCEKPAVSTQKVTWIVVGVVLGLFVFGTLSVLLFFHLKKKKRDERDDIEDQFQMSDYGLDDPVSARAKKPQGPQRLSFDDLPKPGQPNRNLQANNPFDDTQSVRSHDGLNPKQAWPKRVDSNETSQTNVPPKV
ncbi:hypothetical protein OQA88_8052 [Cercophora sp. LCS_1]